MPAKAGISEDASGARPERDPGFAEVTGELARGGAPRASSVGWKMAPVDAECVPRLDMLQDADRLGRFTCPADVNQRG